MHKAFEPSKVFGVQSHPKHVFPFTMVTRCFRAGLTRRFNEHLDSLNKASPARCTLAWNAAQLFLGDLWLAAVLLRGASSGEGASAASAVSPGMFWLGSCEQTQPGTGVWRFLRPTLRHLLTEKGSNSPISIFRDGAKPRQLCTQSVSPEDMPSFAFASSLACQGKAYPHEICVARANWHVATLHARCILARP